MKHELKNFQSNALMSLLGEVKEAQGNYDRTGKPQVISLTAPTGSGKTIIATTLMEDILTGNEEYAECPDSVFIWVSDSPELNEQSKMKIEGTADKLCLGQCVTVDPDSFNMEFLEDGHIYFLNTQKLSKTSRLVKGGDGRDYTIWETLENTIQEKYDRLIVIIDEAHRGMKNRGSKEAATTMQKFIKGSPEDGLSPFPVVIGMSATIKRFDALVGSVNSTIRRVVISPSDVRRSGLLKDEVFVLYPKDVTARVDMAVLQAAVDDWKKKCEHWDMYYERQKSRRVNPILLIQVENASGSGISATDLDEVVKTIEDRIGYTFTDEEVVHSFGEKTTLTVNGRTVRYEEPSRIADNMSIKVVLFKDAISTGWDCPRAETMVSFRRASDATYIAQLLGRMLRTPLHQRVMADEYLNGVCLFLPYFNKDTVEKIVKEIRDDESGSIPQNVSYGDTDSTGTLTAAPRIKRPAAGRTGGSNDTAPEDLPLMRYLNGEDTEDSASPELPEEHPDAGEPWSTHPSFDDAPVAESVHQEQPETALSRPDVWQVYPGPERKPLTGTAACPVRGTRTETVQKAEKPSGAVRPTMPEKPVEDIDRVGVIEYVNSLGIQSYEVRRDKVNDYLKSLFKLAGFLSQTGIYAKAVDDIKNDMANMIHDYAEGLKKAGRYDAEIAKRMEFILSAKTFEILEDSDIRDVQMDLLSTTDTDVERQFKVAEKKLKNEGVGMAYGKKYGDIENTNLFRLDVIMFVSDVEAMGRLMEYAEKRYHKLIDENRSRIRTLPEKHRTRYRNIVNDGDCISSHDYHLPMVVEKYPLSPNGTVYTKHLYVDEKSGSVTFKLNGWENGLLKEEAKEDGFVCWLRNPDRKPWSLCIPYEKNGSNESMYPDFLVIRRDGPHDYFVDILEPHDPTRTDNLGKAKGLAKYADDGYSFGRIQLIRKTKKPTGEEGFIRLDMSRSEVRRRIRRTSTNDELDNVFDDYGFFE